MCSHLFPCRFIIYRQGDPYIYCGFIFNIIFKISASMSQLFYTQVPYNKGHGHLQNSIIESFPDLHAHDTFQDRRQYIQETLKYQLLTTKGEDAKNFVNMRECFKFLERNQVEYCLKEKVPGTSFVQAATKLGYRKI